MAHIKHCSSNPRCPLLELVKEENSHRGPADPGFFVKMVSNE